MHVTAHVHKEGECMSQRKYAHTGRVMHVTAHVHKKVGCMSQRMYTRKVNACNSACTQGR